MKPSIRWREEHGREIAMLGAIEVGYVMPTGGRKNRPRWLFALAPNHIGSWHSEPTIERARSAIEALVDEWLRRAGLIA
ncbi:MAG: hypothetical protein K2Y20_13880 [Sphingomonas sp.]|nr:hypothetical protein [Sphingomonas sp.]